MLAASLAVGGCDDNTTTTTPTSPDTTAAIPAGFQTFGGTLAVQGSSLFTFDITTAGTVNVTLTSVSTSNTTPLPQTVLGIAYGTPSTDLTTCNVTISKSTAPGLATQMTTQGAKGAACVVVSDVGQLTGPVTFVVRVAHS